MRYTQIQTPYVGRLQTGRPVANDYQLPLPDRIPPIDAAARFPRRKATTPPPGHLVVKVRSRLARFRKPA